MLITKEYSRVHRYVVFILIGIVSCSGFVDCGGSQGANPVSPALAPAVIQPSSSITPSAVSVDVSYALDHAATSTSQQYTERHLEYISSANLSLSVVVTPVGGSPSSPYVGSCTTVTCTVTFTANPGPTNLAFSLTDAAGGGGNVLSTFSTMQIIQPQALNTLSFTANPVVNSVVISPGLAAVNAGTPTTIPVAVNALDPDGNTIVGAGNYVNSSGTPLAILLNASSSQDYGYGSLSMQGPLRITASGQAASYAKYDGNWLASGSITATTTMPIAGSITSGSITITPTIAHEYTLPTTTVGPGLITTGPDGNIWFGEENVPKVGKINPKTGTITEYTLLSSNALPMGITAGPDGNVWFLENGGATSIGVITPSGTVTEYSSPYANLAQYIAVGSDGGLWFTSGNGNYVARLTTSGVLHQFGLFNSHAYPYGITSGSDKNIWFTEQTSNVIVKMATSGVELVDYTVPTSGSGPTGLAAGPDGNLWFTEYFTNKIGKVTTSGTFTEYTIPTPNSSPVDINPGPDGCLYFTESSTNKIGRVTTSGSITEIAIPTASAVPAGVTMGPDGNIWFTEFNTGKIGKYVY